MTEFLYMDGYAVYVWPSFILTILMLVLGIWVPLRAHRRLRRAIAAKAGRS